MQAFFVESAWNGNDGTWQNKISKNNTKNNIDLVDAINSAKKNKIPTIFWNKEDPPHFERFIDNAKNFDFVFTSDANTIVRYKEVVGHNRIFPLPFAAQPKIHNPILAEKREFNVCFSGTYYGDIYPERKKDMDLLLKPALDFGLHIYDRQFGIVDPNESTYRFPSIYQSAIKGRLEYLEMIKYYKKYKVFLNVNSIKSSPTMFSRRVFELLASGTAVISNYSKGIEELLGDLVLFSESADETRNHLEKLLSDDDYWARLSVKGIRKVLESHTYFQRLNFIFEKCDLDLIPQKKPKFSILAYVENIKDINNLQKILSQQVYKVNNLILLVNDTVKNAKVVKLRNNLASFNKIKTNFLSDINEIQKHITGDYLAIINPGNYYGPNYLHDYSLSFLYHNEGKLFGKNTYFSQINDDLKLENCGHEFVFTSRVLTSTLVVRKEIAKKINYLDLLQSEWYEGPSKENEILSLDRYNFLKVVASDNIDEEFCKKIIN